LLTNTPRAFQPLRNGIEYHRFYYEQQKEVDKHIGTVVDALANDRRNYGDTVVIYLSDHGEMLGSHGGMFQKWHSAYDEILKVPFIFHNPTLLMELKRPIFDQSRGRASHHAGARGRE